MANAYINVYKNNPTAGGTDGTAVSLDGTYTSPITVTLDKTISESKKVKLAIRCESGYVTSVTTVIQPSAGNNNRWKLSLTEDGTYSTYLQIASFINDTNTIFWAQAYSSSSENPTTDREVSFNVTTTVVPVT